MIRTFVHPILPQPPATFTSFLPGDVKVELRYREAIGVSTLLQGGFETSEIDMILRYARHGDTIIDVGANVGLYTVPLAEKIGPYGRAFAFEPLADNAARLRQNVRSNSLHNVEVFEMAAGTYDGFGCLHIADDVAYASTQAVAAKHATGSSIAVPIARLDTVWAQRGAPPVSVMKVDVEGAELDVLQGSERLLGQCHPALLIEAASAASCRKVASFLSRFGYRRRRPSGFMPWNHLFVWEGSPESVDLGSRWT